ncbi:class I SAM-dependent methyltransferase [Chitinolyticbacter meiyuanensis]|uniref:class I SAM-dependent methyltransferase n=1 Tax=Chitinolyticbacter meiyuanensis TaxID=682798 RepID=UPI0011E5E4AD|nr:class I SAM-dependent methyltransferase [Chitinolyticbacter meiyuanensis]
MNTIDFGLTADDYRIHRAGFPDAFYDRLADWGLLQAGTGVLDLGTGTGTLARGLARCGCHVTGLDIAPAMLAAARALDQEAGVDVQYHLAAAEHIGLPEAQFDLVCAGQCWHWFDGFAVAHEANRLMRSGGMLLIAHYDWLPLPGSVAAASEHLILRHNPHWRGADGCGIHTAGFAHLAEAGFTVLESLSFDHLQHYTHQGWRGRIRASAGVAASLGNDAVASFDAEHAALLAECFSAEPLEVPHRVFLLLGSKRN